MDSEIQKIENIIEVMCRLKELEKELRRGEIFSLILALIATAEIPNITLLPSIEDMGIA